jgi:hypothetical protein
MNRGKRRPNGPSLDRFPQIENASERGAPSEKPENKMTPLRSRSSTFARSCTRFGSTSG